METCVNKQSQFMVKVVRYLSDGRTSETTAGGPLELGDTFLFGGTDSTPERSHALTAAIGVGLHERRRRDKNNVRVISKNGRNHR